MAELDVTGLLAKTASTGYSYLVWIMAAVVIGAILWMVWYFSNYNRLVNMKVWTNNSSFYMQDKAREVKKDGVTYWRLWTLKVDASVPPPNSIYISNKGKRIAEGYFTVDTGVIWATDLTTRESIIDKINEINNNPSSNRKVIEGAFQPLTTQERSMLADQTIRAIKRRGQNFLETISQLATPMMMLVFVVLVLIFWGDIAKPVQALQQSNAEISKENAIISQQNARMLTVLSGGKANLSIEQTIPPSGVST